MSVTEIEMFTVVFVVLVRIRIQLSRCHSALNKSTRQTIDPMKCHNFRMAIFRKAIALVAQPTVRVIH